MRVITDSSADLPLDLVKMYHVEIVPFRIHFEEDTFRDFYDLNMDDYYRLLRHTKFSLKVTPPSVEDFMGVYSRLSKEDNCLVSLHLSSSLGGAYDNAVIASNRFPNVNIKVINSQQASIGLGMSALAGARAIQEGMSEDDVVRAINRAVLNIETYFSIDSIDFLNRAGYISKFEALAGNILSITPLLLYKDGKVRTVSRISGKKYLINRIVELVSEKAYDTRILKVGLIRTDNEALFYELSYRIEKIMNVQVEYAGKVGGVITSRLGPGIIGVACYPIG